MSLQSSVLLVEEQCNYIVDYEAAFNALPKEYKLLLKRAFLRMISQGMLWVLSVWIWVVQMEPIKLDLEELLDLLRGSIFAAMHGFKEISLSPMCAETHANLKGLCLAEKLGLVVQMLQGQMVIQVGVDTYIANMRRLSDSFNLVSFQYVPHNLNQTM